jgi:orotate phosphoribosyltransferase
MNIERKDAARIAVQNDLLVISAAKARFPGRKGSEGVDVIVDVRSSAANLPLRTFLLGSLQQELLRFKPDSLIAGISRGGVMLGAQLALIAGRGYATVLPEGPRPSGLQRAVEGKVRDKTVILFDNVVSTGGSVKDAVAQIERAGGAVEAAIVIANYGPVPRFDFPFVSLFSVRELVNAAYESGLISTTRHKTILERL